MYEEVPIDANVLINTIMKTLEKMRLRGDLSSDTINYFLVKDPKFARFYMTYRVDRLFQTAAFTMRIYLHFWTTICNHLLRELNHILRRLIIF